MFSQQCFPIHNCAFWSLQMPPLSQVSREETLHKATDSKPVSFNCVMNHGNSHFPEEKKNLLIGNISQTKTDTAVIEANGNWVHLYSTRTSQATLDVPIAPYSKQKTWFESMTQRKKKVFISAYHHGIQKAFDFFLFCIPIIKPWETNMYIVILINQIKDTSSLKYVYRKIYPKTNTNAMRLVLKLVIIKQKET